MTRTVLLGAFAALAIAAPARAGDPAEIGCVAAGYSAQGKAEIDALLATVSFVGNGQDPALDALGDVMVEPTLACAERLAWTDAEIETAMLHEFGRLMELGFVRHGALAPSDLARIDAALGKGDRTALWAALEAQLAIGMAGGEDSLSDADADVYGAFMIETGLPLDEATGERVGVYLAAKAMQRASARAFAAE